MPSTAQKLYQSVADSLDAHNMHQAIAACRELNTHYPEFFPGWAIAGEIHHRLNKPGAGLIAMERCLALQPGSIDILLQKVGFLQALERNIEARDLLMNIAGTSSEESKYDATTHDQIARLLASQELHEHALLHYRKALALRPDNAELWYNLATAQRFLGQIEEAETTLDKALSLSPLNFEAQAMRSSLRRQTPHSNHISELQSVLADPALAEAGQANINYALAKEFDDLEDYQQSFRSLKRGADVRRKLMAYSVESDLEMITAIGEAYSTALFTPAPSGFDSPEPIFILGMPRTGTTLVERILGRHSQIHSAGELDTFGREMMRQVSALANIKNLSRTELAQISSRLNYKALGQAYIDGTRPGTGSTAHFIDKLPFNFLYAGLIHLALPKAKIINLTRHPMASGYAIYKQLFRDAYPFSYDLQDLGRYYVAYHQLMDHWQNVMPGVIHRVAYEDIVADIETESRTLLEFCELEWEPQCLNFYDSQQASTTASASQVRQPIYTSSLDKWRHYATQLKPLQDILNAAGIDTA